MSVTVQGFKKYVRQNIDVQVQDTSGGWPVSLVSNYFFYSAVTVKPNNTMMWGNVWFPA